jgi:thiamine biosynthesis lipoprotein
MDGKTYHHIIDAKSGAPSNKDIVSVTVISKNAVKSEAYSTALFIMGIDKGLDFHQKIGNFKAIFIKKDGKKFVANGERALDNYKQS